MDPYSKPVSKDLIPLSRAKFISFFALLKTYIVYVSEYFNL